MMRWLTALLALDGQPSRKDVKDRRLGQRSMTDVNDRGQGRPSRDSQHQT